jgi:hypothetical protein
MQHSWSIPPIMTAPYACLSRIFSDAFPKIYIMENIKMFAFILIVSEKLRYEKRCTLAHEYTYEPGCSFETTTMQRLLHFRQN